jgi:myo-inositol-1(or 4)-monophosphatase
MMNAIHAAELSEIARVTELAAREGAAQLMQLFGEVAIHEKGPRDLVTQADIASQRAIKAIVQREFPEHLFVGEEVLDDDAISIEQLKSMSPERICWVVDPLDGTTNYAHGMPAFAVSVAVIKDGKVLCGAVYDPSLDEYFSAVVSRGAQLNGQPIHASRTTDLNSALIAASFPAHVKAGSDEVTYFVRMLEKCQALRRLGSAALNMCYVASGRLDGYWATSVKTWDVAAGYLIASEAGVTVTAFQGGQLDLWNPKLLMAASESLHQDMRQVLSGN